MELQWPLILFTTFLAWAGGLFATQGVYALRGKAAKAQMPALITSLVLLIIGGIAVFFHLQHWERIFNGFGHITSGITQELIAIVVMVVIMVVYFVYLRRNKDTVPNWVAVLAIIIGIVLVCVCGHSYMMPSRPGWDSIFQIGSLIGAAFALGPATMAVITSVKKCDDDAVEINGKSNMIGEIVNVVLTACYLIALSVVGGTFTEVGYYFDPTGPTRGITDYSALSPFSGDSVGVTVLVIACVIIGLVAAIMGKKKGNWKLWGIVAVVAVFIGALALRVLFYNMGVSVFAFYDISTTVG
jgi:DMSO reductase anchor subunit